METNEVEAAVVLAAQEFLDGVAHLVGEEHLASVFLQDEACADLVSVIVGVSELELLRTAEVAGVGLGQEGGVVNGCIPLLLFEDLLIAPHELMLAVARHLVEGDFVLAFVFP